MSILDITKDIAIPLVGAVYDVAVNVTVSKYTIDMFMKDQSYHCEDIQNQLKNAIEQLESLGPDIANIKTLIKDITINHDKLLMDATIETDAHDNIHSLFLYLKSTAIDHDILSLILRKKPMGILSNTNFDLLIGQMVDDFCLRFADYLVDGRDPIVQNITRALKLCPLEHFPGQFMGAVQYNLLKYGQHLNYDPALPDPAAREYFEIREYSEYGNLQGFKVFWGEEELFKIVFPYKVIKNFEARKFKKDYRLCQC